MSKSQNSPQALRDKRDALYQEALADPNSQAAEMVRMLLLPGVSSLQPEASNPDPDVLLGEERRHSRVAREARESDAEAGAETEEPLAAEGTPRSEEWKRRLDEVAQAVEEARAQQMTRQQGLRPHLRDRRAEKAGGRGTREPRGGR